MLTCAALVKLVTAYMEGGLEPDQRQRFDEHVAICPPCRAYLAQLRDTKRVLGRISQEDLSPRAQEALLHAFREWDPDS